MSAGKELLHKLLDRWERQRVSGRRISIRPPLHFAAPQERTALYDALHAAQAAGAVALDMDRDAPHLIARVSLVDSAILYRYVGRERASDKLDAALRQIRSVDVESDEAKHVAELFVSRWSAGGTVASFAKDDPAAAAAFLKLLDTALKPLSGPQLPLRSRSVRLLGDSKALERSLPKILAVLRQIGRLPPELDRDDALKLLGLEKFPQPVLISGPVRLNGALLPDLPYAGLPPEAIDQLDAPDATSLLTIENLESFNRHVREARGKGDVVIYSAGFPSPTVLLAFENILKSARLQQIWHWGDIDWGGLLIARQFELASHVPLRLHLMSGELARLHGKPAASGKRPRNMIPESSSLAPLARYLSDESSRTLEQESLDPRPIKESAPNLVRIEQHPAN